MIYSIVVREILRINNQSIYTITPIITPASYGQYIASKQDTNGAHNVKTVNHKVKRNTKKTKHENYVAKKDKSKKATMIRPVQIKKPATYQTNGIINLEHKNKIAHAIEHGRNRKMALRNFDTPISFEEEKADNLQELVQAYEQTDKVIQIIPINTHTDEQWLTYIQNKEAQNESAKKEFEQATDCWVKMLDNRDKKAQEYLQKKTEELEASKNKKRKRKTKKSYLTRLLRNLELLELDDLYENTGNMKAVINAFNQRKR